MTNCAKCGAELIGSRKFCAACGAPTDPSSLKRDVSISSGPASQPAPPTNAQINVPSTAYGPPVAPGAAPVNPFAATASPSSRAVGSPYGPPPGTPVAASSSNPVVSSLGSTTPGPAGALDQTAPAPPVSPLAVSNALSQRGAFQQATGDRIAPPPPSQPTGPNVPSGRTGTSPPPPATGGAGAGAPAKKAPGTQIMASTPNPMLPRPGSTPPGSNPPAGSVKPPPQKTQMMDAAAFARLNQTPNASRPSAPNQQAAQPVPPSAQQQPPSALQPPPATVQPPTAQPYSHGQQAPHASPVPPQGHQGGQWGWGTPATAAPPVAAPQGYGFGYAPGARVNVTWSNGQRYPATVSQVSGTQCLVVFPDGQQHWVEMQYLSPG